MNFLFLTHKYPKEKENSCLEKDFVKKLSEEGHNIYVITTTERRLKEETHIFEDGNIKILYVKTGNRTKNYNLIEKILTILSTPFLIKKDFNQFFKDIKIDYLITYTPFMSSLSLIKYFKKRLDCKVALFLWDIMPQTAKDMEVIKNNFIFNYMKKNEAKMYDNVNKVICNCEEAERYVLNNSYKKKESIIFIRNAEYIHDFVISSEKKQKIRKELGYTKEDIVFVFGGNMGMLQKLENILELAKVIESENRNIKFILIGDGKDKEKLRKRIEQEDIKNLKILERLSRTEYESVIASFDCGLISLNEKNTVPNFPTKVTAYLKLGLPIFASLDSSAAKGVGKYIEKNNIGRWGKAGNAKDLKKELELFVSEYNKGVFKKRDLIDLYKRDFDINVAYELFIEGIRK